MYIATYIALYVFRWHYRPSLEPGLDWNELMMTVTVKLAQFLEREDIDGQHLRPPL